MGGGRHLDRIGRGGRLVGGPPAGAEAALQRERTATVAGAIAVYMVGMTLRAERWYWLLRHVDARPRRADTFRLIFVGYMGNTVIPARGGDAMRVYLGAPRAKAGVRQVIGTLFAERILDVAVLASLLAVLAFVVLRGIDLPIGGSSWLLLAGGLALAAAIALVLYLARKRHRVSRILRFVEPMTVATRELRGRFGFEMAALTLLIWSIEATTYLITSRAVGLDLQPSQALYLVSLASAFALIPSGPGYAGTLDAGIIFGVHAIGGSNRAALSYLVTLRFVLLRPHHPARPRLPAHPLRRLVAPAPPTRAGQRGLRPGVD